MPAPVVEPPPARRSYVRIQDRRLGLLYYAFLAAVTSYIVGVVIIKNEGYLDHADADGVTRLQVRWGRAGALCCCRRRAVPHPPC